MPPVPSVPGPGQEVFRFEPRLGSAPQRSPLWIAPGTLPLDEVVTGWETGRLSSLRHVSGPWGMVGWDPGPGEFLVSADPVGVLPVYWARTTDGAFVVSTLVAPIVDRPDVDDRPDYEGILLNHGGQYLVGAEGSRRTSFAAISKIPIGHVLRVRPDGSVRLDRYWDPASLPGPDTSLSLADSAHLLRERIDAAVRRLIPVDEPIGAHVSGGLDCTAVACMAQRFLTESGRGLVAGYSWAPSEDSVPRFPGDERQLLDDVAALAGFPIRTVGPDDAGSWFWQLDPLKYPTTNHLRESHVQAQARDDGVRILLSGWGGDELSSFNGRTVVRQLLRRGRARTAERELSQAFALHHGRLPGARRRLRSFAGAGLAALPPNARAVVPRRRRVLDLREAEVAEAVRAFSPLAADLREENRRAFAAAHDHHAMQLLLLQYGHLQRRIAGWHQSGHLMGLQYRYPLLDLGVVETALRLPWQAFRHQGWSRPAFRMAVQPWVPDSVTWNVSKYEPALYWPPEGGVDITALVGQWRHLDDPQYEAVMRLAARARGIGSGPQLPSHLRVLSRPDRALRA